MDTTDWSHPAVRLGHARVRLATGDDFDPFLVPAHAPGQSEQLLLCWF
jgi:hypothetical protein